MGGRTPKRPSPSGPAKSCQVLDVDGRPVRLPGRLLGRTDRVGRLQRVTLWWEEDAAGNLRQELLLPERPLVLSLRPRFAEGILERFEDCRATPHVASSAGRNAVGAL